ncbi:uncharacterized protein LOC142537720 [Primulina tabacum]|uniref:uncharacterized protein LOC142537720 n=1 Tax=Primulina tabacum TaxID=48773 RepID=UPI003F594BCA
MDEELNIIAFGPGKKTLRIAPDLDPWVREELVTCLQANLSFFAWSAQELTGTTPDVVEHWLNILSNARPVKLEKRQFGPEKYKVKKFKRGPDCEKAFGELKKYLPELPVLAKPVAEIRYSGLEKLSLALMMMARRLRPYFLSHTIVVLTNSPLGRILTHSDMSGHLVNWTTELGEYDIQYEPRTAIKAQALADILAENVHRENEDPWKVYVDGSSSKDGSGVGVVLISPAGEEVKLAVRLEFRASNNETKYEAVLAGLRAARNVGATRVLVFFDSQLVAQQMEGIYDVKDEKLIEYAQEMDRVREKFTEAAFEQIHRKENERADTLAKMTGTMGI